MSKKFITNLYLIIAFVGLLVNILYFSYYFINEYYNTQNIKKYFSYSHKTNLKHDYINYLGILEIPAINLKKGFYDINTINNNIKYNIQILNNSTMPDVKNSLLVIAAHSGNGINAYFTDLNKLKLNDNIYIYYKNKKYIYSINKIYEEPKKSYLTFPSFDTTTLILTTCSEKNKNNQLIIESLLTKTT